MPDSTCKSAQYRVDNGRMKYPAAIPFSFRRALFVGVCALPFLCAFSAQAREAAQPSIELNLEVLEDLRNTAPAPHVTPARTPPAGWRKGLEGKPTAAPRDSAHTAPVKAPSRKPAPKSLPPLEALREESSAPVAPTPKKDTAKKSPVKPLPPVESLPVETPSAPPLPVAKPPAETVKKAPALPPIAAPAPVAPPAPPKALVKPTPVEKMLEKQPAVKKDDKKDDIAALLTPPNPLPTPPLPAPVAKPTVTVPEVKVTQPPQTAKKTPAENPAAPPALPPIAGLALPPAEAPKKPEIPPPAIVKKPAESAVKTEDKKDDGLFPNLKNTIKGTFGAEDAAKPVAPKETPVLPPEKPAASAPVKLPAELPPLPDFAAATPPPAPTAAPSLGGLPSLSPILGEQKPATTTAPESPLAFLDKPAETKPTPTAAPEAKKPEEKTVKAPEAKPDAKKPESKKPAETKKTAPAAPIAPALPPSTPAPVTPVAEKDLTPPPAAPPSGDAAPKTAPPTGNSASTLTVVFAGDSSAVPADMQPKLADLVKKMTAGKGARAKIIAYAAGSGNEPSLSRRLALARALALRAMMIEQGADSLSINVVVQAAKGNGDQNNVDVISSGL